MKSRTFVSLFLAFIFIGMAVTGVMSFMEKYNELLSGFHVIFSLTFVLTTFFHLFKNIKPLKNYFSAKKNRMILVSVIVLVCVLLSGVFYSLPPFSNIIEYGVDLRSQTEVDKKIEYRFTTHSKVVGKDIRIDLRAGGQYATTISGKNGKKRVSIPQSAVWLEDRNGKYLETLYVSGKSGTGSYRGGSRRPESLPVWSHARNILAGDGLLMPTKENALPDAITGATPLTSFSVTSKYSGPESINLMIEVNKSFDPNGFYNKNNFPDDKLYSKSPNGQPSLIYRAELTGLSGIVLVKLLGHGHHSGRDGKVIQDVSDMTTALDILKGAVVEY